MQRIAVVVFFASIGLMTGCAGPKPQAATAKPVKANESVSPKENEVSSSPKVSSTATSTLHGSTFELPPNWRLEKTDHFLLIQDPDAQLKMWLVDVKGLSGKKAVDAAWKKVDSEFSRNVASAVSPPDTQGWDSLFQANYEVAAKDSRAIIGIAREKGGIAFVVLIDGPIPTLQKRGAQLGQLITSQKAPGVRGESFAGKTTTPLNSSAAKQLSAFVTKALKSRGVPGAALAVIQNGNIVYRKGFGVKRKGRNKAVTPETTFMIGSTTKSLTTLMMAVMVDKGLLSWETPMRKILPSFGLGDKATADRVELQHSVCACTGLPRQDLEFIFEFEGTTPEMRLSELSKMKPTTGFGETFQYSNALVSAGGFAAAYAKYPKLSLTDAYEKSMDEFVFEPLKMEATGFSPNRKNFAFPHGSRMDGTYKELPLSIENAVKSVGPAGGAWSNVDDLAQYALLELGRKKGTLLSQENLLERRKPRIRMGEKSHYGLGLMVSNESDLKSVGHNGNTMGFTALLKVWPEHDLGLVILANAQGTNGFTAVIERRLLELVLGAEAKASKRLEFIRSQREKNVKIALSKIASSNSAKWFAPYIGDYENEALGSLSIRKKGRRHILDVGEWKSEVVRYKEANQSLLMLTDAPVASLPFQTVDGNLLLDVGQQQYLFVKK